MTVELTRPPLFLSLPKISVAWFYAAHLNEAEFSEDPRSSMKSLPQVKSFPQHNWCMIPLCTHILLLQGTPSLDTGLHMRSLKGRVERDNPLSLPTATPLLMQPRIQSAFQAPSAHCWLSFSVNQDPSALLSSFTSEPFLPHWAAIVPVPIQGTPGSWHQSRNESYSGHWLWKICGVHPHSYHFSSIGPRRKFLHPTRKTLAIWPSLADLGIVCIPMKSGW